MKLIICVLALVALAFADPHNIYVGCDDATKESHYAAADFPLAVDEANLNLYSKIHICCCLYLTTDSLTGNDFEFNFNVELVGSKPAKGFVCDSQATVAARQITARPKCNAGDSSCAQSTSKIMGANVKSEDAFDEPEAWIFTTGNAFIFSAQAKIFRLGFIAVCATAPVLNKSREIWSGMTAEQRFKNLRPNLVHGKDKRQVGLLPLNFIGAGEAFGGYSYEFSIEKSVIALDPGAFEEDFLLADPINTWVVAVASQQLKIKESFILALDFHILLRYSPFVQVTDSILNFDFDLALFLFEEAVGILPPLAKQVDPFAPLPQLHLSISHTDIIFIWIPVIDSLPVAIADLGILPIVFSEFIPEIYDLILDDVFWLNFERVIGAGTYYNFVERGYDYQETSIDDYVLFLNFEFSS